MEVMCRFLTQYEPGQPRMAISQPCNRTRSGSRVSALLRPPPGGMDAVYNHITTAMRQRTSMQGRATPMQPGTPGAYTARVVPMPTVAVILTIRAAAFWSASAMRPALPTSSQRRPGDMLRYQLESGLERMTPPERTARPGGTCAPG